MEVHASTLILREWSLGPGCPRNSSVEVAHSRIRLPLICTRSVAMRRGVEETLSSCMRTPKDGASLCLSILGLDRCCFVTMIFFFRAQSLPQEIRRCICFITRCQYYSLPCHISDMNKCPMLFVDCEYSSAFRDPSRHLDIYQTLASVIAWTRPWQKVMRLCQLPRRNRKLQRLH